jgi:hypothetical protein
MGKCSTKNWIKMFTFISSAKEFAKGQLMEGKSNENGCQKLAIFEKKQQNQQARKFKYRKSYRKSFISSPKVTNFERPSKIGS